MRLIDYLTEEYIMTNCDASSKEALLEDVLDLAGKNPAVKDLNKLKAAVLEREHIMSTGVGKGFAIPHGKTDSVDDIIIAFIVTANPVEYGSMDNEPVRLVLLIASRENLVGQRLKLLSRAAKIMSSEHAREALLGARNASEVLDIFRREEDRIGD